MSSSAGNKSRSHRSPERPLGGRSKRTLIENACAACQKRKSRCDGQRPVCSRCQTLHTECSYDTERGESRWSAIRRRNRVLEIERDEARELIAQIRSRPESEAQEIYRRIRAETYTSDMRTSFHEADSAVIDGTWQQQPQQPQQQPQTQHDQDLEHDHQDPQHQSLQHRQLQRQTQRQTQQQLPQQQGTNSLSQSGYTPTGSTYRLPPLWSIVGVPTSGFNATQQLPQPSSSLTPRTMSQMSATSSGSYTSLSSPDGHSERPPAPSTNQPRD